MTTRRPVALLVSLLVAGGAGLVSLRAGQAPAETGMLVGTVFLSSSRPAAGVEVAVWRGDDRRTAVSDEAGEFELHDLPVGLYQWTATRDGERPQGLARDRSVIVWPERIADWRIHLGGFSSAGEGTEAERTTRLVALEKAVSRWLTRRPVAYEFSLSLRCFCPLPRGPVPYFVQGDRALPLVDVSRGRFALSHYDTVEELFEAVAATIDRRPDEFSISFDDTFGHPVSFQADPARHVFDEELGFEASGLRAVGEGRSSPSGSITGRVLAPGRPVVAVEIASRRKGIDRRTVTDAQGRFRLDGLHAGIHTIEIRSADLLLEYPGHAVALVFPDRTTETSLYPVPRGQARPGPPRSASQEALRQSRLARLELRVDRWISQSIDDYVLEVTSDCPFRCGRATFRVSNGKGAMLSHATGASADLQRRQSSVEALFERVLEQAARSPELFSVSYDSALGYPSSLVVDGPMAVLDDELSFRVLRLSVDR